MFEPANEKSIQFDQNEKDYEAPAIIYEGTLTTRAGSGFGVPPSDPARTDPSDLFDTSP